MNAKNKNALPVFILCLIAFGFLITPGASVRAASSMTFSPAGCTLPVGGVQTVTLTNAASGVSYTAASTNSAVAQAEGGQTFTVTGVSVGDASVTITASDGATASVPIHVSANTIALDTTSQCWISKNGSYNFLLKSPKSGVTYTARPADGKILSVQFAKDTANGKAYTVRGLKPGATWIAVYGSDGTVASFPAAVGSSLTLDTTSYTLPPEGIYSIGLQWHGSEPSDFRVYAADSNIVSVMRMPSGVIVAEGVKEGETDVVFDFGDVRAAVHFTVRNGVSAGGDSAKQTVYF